MDTGTSSHDSRRPPLQDIRFAVVLNGGVSLAVWMGGATHELNVLTWASEVPTTVRSG